MYATHTDKNSQDLGNHYVGVLNNILQSQTGSNANTQNSMTNLNQISSFLNNQINNQLNKFVSSSGSQLQGTQQPNLYNQINPFQSIQPQFNPIVQPQIPPQPQQAFPNNYFPFQDQLTKPETIIQNHSINVNHNTINVNNNINANNFQMLANLINRGNPKPDKVDQNLLMQQLLANLMKKNQVPTSTTTNIAQPINMGLLSQQLNNMKPGQIGNLPNMNNFGNVHFPGKDNNINNNFNHLKQTLKIGEISTLEELSNFVKASQMKYDKIA